MKLINTKYGFGDVVYLATDEYQLPRMVTALTVRGDNIIYELSCGANIPSWHTEIEMTIEKNVLQIL